MAYQVFFTSVAMRSEWFPFLDLQPYATRTQMEKTAFVCELCHSTVAPGLGFCVVQRHLRTPCFFLHWAPWWWLTLLRWGLFEFALAGIAVD